MIFSKSNTCLLLLQEEDVTKIGIFLNIAAIVEFFFYSLILVLHTYLLSCSHICPVSPYSSGFKGMRATMRVSVCSHSVLF